MAAIALSALYSAAMIPLAPLLIATHPAVLEMVAGSNASVVAASSFSAVRGSPHPAFLVAVALPAMMRSDWIMWWAGKLWGHRIVDKLGKQRRHPGRLGSAFRDRALGDKALGDRASGDKASGDRASGERTIRDRRRVWLMAPLVAAAAFMPGGTQAPLYASAGWLGLPLVPFLVADVIGTTAWVSLLTTSGYLLGSNGVAMARVVSHYTLLAICVPVITMIVPNAWRAWRASPAAAGGAAALRPE